MSLSDWLAPQGEVEKVKPLIFQLSIKLSTEYGHILTIPYRSYPILRDFVRYIM